MSSFILLSFLLTKGNHNASNEIPMFKIISRYDCIARKAFYQLKKSALWANFFKKTDFMEARGVEPLSKHLATSTSTTIELSQI